jgi:hypothetical protein
MYEKQLFSLSILSESSVETTFGRLLARTFTIGPSRVFKCIIAIGLTAKLLLTAYMKTFFNPALPCLAPPNFIECKSEKSNDTWKDIIYDMI